MGIATHNYDVEIGDVVYLVKHYDITNDREHLTVQKNIPVDNSDLETENGPLGTWNNVTRTALGRVTVTGWGKAVNTVRFRE